MIFAEQVRPGDVLRGRVVRRWTWSPLVELLPGATALLPASLMPEGAAPKDLAVGAVVVVEHVGDRHGLVGDLGQVASGSLDRGMPEATGDQVHCYALGGKRGRVVGAQDVRVAKPMWNPRLACGPAHQVV